MTHVSAGWFNIKVRAYVRAELSWRWPSCLNRQSNYVHLGIEAAAQMQQQASIESSFYPSICSVPIHSQSKWTRRVFIRALWILVHLVTAEFTSTFTIKCLGNCWTWRIIHRPAIGIQNFEDSGQHSCQEDLQPLQELITGIDRQNSSVSEILYGIRINVSLKQACSLRTRRGPCKDCLHSPKSTKCWLFTIEFVICSQRTHAHADIIWYSTNCLGHCKSSLQHAACNVSATSACTIGRVQGIMERQKQCTVNAHCPKMSLIISHLLKSLQRCFLCIDRAWSAAKLLS